jgi:hypothetical protein
MASQLPYETVFAGVAEPEPEEPRLNYLPELEPEPYRSLDWQSIHFINYVGLDDINPRHH